MNITEADYIRVLFDMNNERITKMELRLTKLEEDMKTVMNLLLYGPRPET